MFLAFLACAVGAYAFGILTAVLCLAAEHGDALEERERALARWEALPSPFHEITPDMPEGLRRNFQVLNEETAKGLRRSLP